ncbi:korC [Klebsiella pneumoniae]|uniref:korC n=1 Tax=Klebsiella pneumoniae TaxID=573 RepID=UPI003EDEE55D
MNADNERYFSDLIEAKKFNGYTLVSGEHWQKPTVEEIQLVRGLILLTDSQLANRLDVDERALLQIVGGDKLIIPFC